MIIIDDDGVMHKVLPIDTLDKIRAEIMSKDGLEEALEIIDKYREEQSE